MDNKQNSFSPFVRRLSILCALSFASLAVAQDLNAKYPVVQGKHRVTTEWSINLPSKFNRRVDDGEMVLWRPGATVKVSLWNAWNNNRATTDQRVTTVKLEKPKNSYAEAERQRGALHFYTYRVPAASTEKPSSAFHCHAFSDPSHLRLIIQIEGDQDASQAQTLCDSVEYLTP